MAGYEFIHSASDYHQEVTSKMETKIPKVDEGISAKGNAYEENQAFYRKHSIKQYVHSVRGGKYLKLEIGDIMKGIGYGDQVELTSNDEPPAIRRLSYIEINKQSFLNNIECVNRYINYFIEYFDEDDELLTAYVFMLYLIMNRETDLSQEAFTDQLINWFATKSMIAKVVKMVDYNTDVTLLKRPERSTYDPSIQLTSEHLYAIMCLSCIHKLIIPIVSQYFNTIKDKLKSDGVSDKALYYKVFTAFIPYVDEIYDVSLYDKLYHTATTRISKTENHDKQMWNRRYCSGVTPTYYAGSLMKDLFIDISQKMVFSKSAIVFIHVCFDQAIKNELVQQDKFEFMDMDTTPSDSVNETLGKFDQWQTANAGTSELTMLRNGAEIIDLVNYMAREFDIDLKSSEFKEEYKFYRENMLINDFQRNVIFLYYAKKLGSYDTLKTMKSSQFIKLIIMMKHDLIEQNYIYLPQFITAKIDATAAKRYNRRKVEKAFTEHPCYQDWIDQYEHAAPLVKNDSIITAARIMISNPIKVVDFDPDINGKLLTVKDSAAADEFIRFNIYLV